MVDPPVNPSPGAALSDIAEEFIARGFSAAELLQEPECPTPLLFQPDSLRRIESARPDEGITLIAPPEANSLGDARLRYPLSLPPGRGGMRPELDVDYDSSRGNGWMGLGWNIRISEITIDTRWGVPRYDAALETETYLLDGEMLTPVAHRGSLQPCESEKEFRVRVNTRFQRIIRHGDAPAGCWWEVIDTDGVRSFYGGVPETTSPHPDAVLAHPVSGAVFRWMLRERRDPWGNTVQYEYAHESAYGAGSAVYTGHQIYPKRIRYTGFGGTPGPYSVQFIRDRETSGKGGGMRPDIVVDCRSGFKMATADRLVRVEVRLQDDLIRAFDFLYEEGAFRKTLLKSVSQRGAGNELLAIHEFDYHDDIRNPWGGYEAFSSAQTWNTWFDDMGWKLPALGEASALGGETSTEVGGHFYAGFNPWSPTKQNSGGAKVGYSRTTGHGLLDLLDITGDSLPDKVFEKDGEVYFRKNEFTPASIPPGSFGPKRGIPTLPTLVREHSDSLTAGAEVYPPASNIIYDYTHNFTTRSSYLIDVNGDGFVDRVDDGSVTFNHPDANGIPTFTADSADTPVPIGEGAIDATDLIDDFTDMYEQRIDTFPLIDSIRRWVAPCNGLVEVSGDVRLIEDLSDERQRYAKADGVRVAIQLNSAELWAARVEPDDHAPRTPTGVGAVPVRRGDRLYFRVQSVHDGAYDQVEWDPCIEYRGVDQDRLDANQRRVYRFRASEDFTLAGRASKIRMPYKGTIRLLGDLVKHDVTTDDIALAVVINGTSVLTKSMAWNETGSIALDDDVDVQVEDLLELLVRVDSPIDVTRIDWIPEVVYIAAEGPSSVTDPDGNYFIRFNPPYDVDLYPEQNLAMPQDAWTAPEKGTVRIHPQVWLLAPYPWGDPFDSDITVTAKSGGKRLGKRTIPIRDGVQPDLSDFTFTIEVEEDDKVFFDFSTRDGRNPDGPGLSGRIWNPWVVARYTDPPGLPAAIPPSDFHRAVRVGEEFPESFRGWSVIGYNGNRQWADRPIDESRLRIPNAQTYNPSNATVYPASPLPVEHQWRAADELCWVEAVAMSSSRLGMDSIDVPRPDDFAGARASSIMSTGYDHAVGLAVGPFSGSMGLGASTGELDYMDMNGDLFPDVVGKSRIQYTDMTGGLEPANRSVAGLDGIRESDNEAWNVGVGFGVGGNPAKSRQKARGDLSPSRASKSKSGGKGKAEANKTAAGDNKKGSSGKQGSDMLELGFEGELATGNSENAFDLIDVNGDALPDRVEPDGSALRVSLNLGYEFAPPETWTFAAVDENHSMGFNAGGSIGFNDTIYGFAGGASFAMNWDWSDEILQDMNGDGLTDRVLPSSGGFFVGLNTGASFLPHVYFQGGANDEIGEEQNTSTGGGAFFTIGIGPLCLAGCYIILNPGAFINYTIARPTTVFADVDGDGCTDHVNSDGDDALQVALNRTRRTNLLKEVRRPLGGVLQLDYARDGNTVDYPPSRWNLSRVDVADGLAGDGCDVVITRYDYGGPVFEPNEREPLGYATVAEKRMRSAGAADADCVILRAYANSTFYNKGLLERVEITDAEGHPFLEVENVYSLIDVDTGAPLALPNSTVATVFPQKIGTHVRFREGNPAAAVSTSLDYEYDEYGNVIRYVDTGGVETEDDLQVELDYFIDPSRNFASKPWRRVVRGGSGEVLSESEWDFDAGHYAPTAIRRLLPTGEAAIQEVEYDPMGNRIRITQPPNVEGERYAVWLEYDAVTNTHVTAIEDVFGYRSTRTYDLRFARPDVTMDVNAQVIDRDYDAFGRLTAVRGPYEPTGGPAAVRFEYHPECQAGEQTPWALTRRLDALRNPDDPIDAVVFMDGLRRIVQTKTDASVFNDAPGVARDVMVISGLEVRDYAGRVVERYYPTTEPLGTPGRFSATRDTVAPTRFDYDVLGRLRKWTWPGGAATTWERAIENEPDGPPRLVTLETDPNEIPTRSYRNARCLVAAIRESDRREEVVIVTRYAYDALGRLVRVVDAHGNITEIEYDTLGRRTVFDNPDSGRTVDAFDLAGNRVARETASLRARGERIEYDFQYTRLQSVRYPLFPGNSVIYEYGPPGAPGHAAGRVTSIVSQAGVERRAHGRLGEIIYEDKTIASDTQGESLNSPEVYTTRFQYDTWGRLGRLAYPDGEVLRFAFDSGGAAAGAHGMRGATRWDYVLRAGYDKFGQMVLIETGNGVVSTSRFDPVTRFLDTLRAAGPSGALIQNLHLDYDAVGMILATASDLPVPPASALGGPVAQTFEHDDFYRLIRATGTWEYSPSKSERFDAALFHDGLHRLVLKRQRHQRMEPSGKPTRIKETSFDWMYTPDVRHPHFPAHIGDRAFQSDLNGNQAGWTHDRNGTRRTIGWDEENRIQWISDNGHMKSFKYNDRGDRILKRGPQGETVAVNEWFTVRNRSVATKHVFLGSRRVGSKVVPGFSSSRPYAPQPETGFLYTYHPDPLGSSVFVADTNGELYEHLQYFPSGEIWVDQRSNTQRTPYAFTARELDEETGLYCLGDRYYDPRTNVWQSAGASVERRVTSGAAGGLHTSAALNPYSRRSPNPFRQRPIPPGAEK